MLFQSMYDVEGRGSMDSSSKNVALKVSLVHFFHDFVGNGVVGMIESTVIFC